MTMHILGALHGLASVRPHMAFEMHQKYNQPLLFNDVIANHF